MSESFEDKLSRVEQMASGSETWDLSDNDIAALKAVLADRRGLYNRVQEVADDLTADARRYSDDAESAEKVGDRRGPCGVQPLIEQLKQMVQDRRVDAETSRLIHQLDDAFRQDAPAFDSAVRFLRDVSLLYGQSLASDWAAQKIRRALLEAPYEDRTARSLSGTGDGRT